MSADRLMEAAREIREAIARGNGVEEGWYSEAELNVIIGRDAALVALMSPSVALGLADWLDWLAANTHDPIDPDSKAATLANRILGAAS